MIKNLLFITLTFFNFYTFAQNFIATYGFANVSSSSGIIDPGATPIVNGLTFGSFSAAGTSANPSASGRFSFTSWPLGGVNGTDDYSNFTGALSPTVYYEVAITVNPGYTLSLSSVTFAVRRSGTGIRNYCMRSDLDNYTNNLAAATGTNAKLSVLPPDVFFWNYDSVSTSSDQKGSQLNPGNLFTSITNSVTFRFFAWNAEASGGSFGIDNVSFIGSVTNTVTLSNPVGITDIPNASKKINVYPNPSGDAQITIESDAGEINKIEIISLTGEMLFVKQLKEKEKIIKLDLSHLNSGICYLKTYSGRIVFSQKVILLHK